VMDGREATRQIKGSAKGKETVIIALTASSFEEEREEILNVGCDDFLRKPFREADLFEALHKHLGVEFIYENTVTPSAPSLSEVTFSGVPDEQRDSLRKALIELDVSATEDAIEKIRAWDAKLAEALSVLAKQFKYQPMLEFLDNDKSDYDKGP